MNENKCLIIVGMHRSGTSLTASVLSKSGLDVGSDLLGSGIGNQEGHFENLDFVDFHRKVLAEKEQHPDGWKSEKIKGLEKYEEEALRLLNKNKSEQWGWKDPRTCLFLDFWEGFLPEAKYLIVYRSPWEVIDSLFRRSTDVDILNNPMLAVNAWVEYNKLILDFYKKHEHKCMIIGIEDMKSDVSAFLKDINEKFGFSLNTKINSPIKEGVFNVSEGEDVALMKVFPEIEEIYEELRSTSNDSLNSDNIGVLPVDIKDLFVNLWCKAENRTEINVLIDKVEVLDKELKSSIEHIRNIETFFMFKVERKLKRMISKLFGGS